MDTILPDIGKALIGLGPGGIVGAIFWWMWKGADAERRELQKLVIDLGRESMSGDLKVADALRSLTQELKDGRSK